VYEVKILADSRNPLGDRLTTFEVTYPRFVHSEFMTHREFSRNSASSRAIPVEKMIERVLKDPAMPVWWGKNQPGMQAREELAGHDLEVVRSIWLHSRDEAVRRAQKLMELGLHKQLANRLIEPWMWITVIASATQMANFFALRCHPDAQPEIAKAAYMMRDAYERSIPRSLSDNEWHLPLVPDRDELLVAGYAPETIALISCGRCARVSYLTHDGKRDPVADIDLAARLARSGHMSPFEHAAQALSVDKRFGNFQGFRQYRKLLPNEANFGNAVTERNKWPNIQ
jgi:thymidylate synthase ThyX